MHECMYVYIYVHVYIYIYIYMYMHTHTHLVFAAGFHAGAGVKGSLFLVAGFGVREDLGMNSCFSVAALGLSSCAEGRFDLQCCKGLRLQA